MQGFLSSAGLGIQRLSKSHRRVAAFIDAHYDKAVFMTAARLGEAVGVSESTVVRFALALGFEGYPRMQEALQQIARHRLTPSQRVRLAEDAREDRLAEAVLRTDMANIRATIDTLDPELFDRVVGEISAARAIRVLGLRSAAPLAQFFAHYLQFIFDNVQILGSGGADVFEAVSRLRPGDLLVAISFPRYSSRTLECMRFARAGGVRVVGITDGPLSPLAEAADLCLDARTDMLSFVDSLAAPLSLINALLAVLGARNREALNGNLLRMEQLWDAHRVYDSRE